LKVNIEGVQKRILSFLFNKILIISKIVVKKFGYMLDV